MGSDREWYQQNVDRLLQPDLWTPPSSTDEEKEKTVSKRLGKVAKDFFKNRSESAPASSAGKTCSEELFSEFIELGEKNAWIDPDKIDKLHSLAESTGLISPQEVGPDPGRHIPAFGRVIEEAYQKSRPHHAMVMPVPVVQGYNANLPAEEVKSVVPSPAEKKRETYNSLASYGLWVFEDVTFPFVYLLKKEPIDPLELEQAFEKRNLQKLMELISKGADVNSIDKGGLSPLHLAVMARNDEIVQKLLSLKADVNKQDLSGETPLHKAASHHASKSSVQHLLMARAKTDIPDKDGNTPLSLAALNNNTACIELLYHAGAAINHKNLIGHTPLFEAAALGWVEAFKLLLRLGADPAIEDNQGFNALSLAKALRPAKLNEVVRTLRDHSPKVASSSKKMLKERFLGHVSEIDDASAVKSLGDLSTVSKGPEKGAGFLPPYSFEQIRKSLREFSREFPQALTPGMSGMIRKATESNCVISQSSLDLMKRW